MTCSVNSFLTRHLLEKGVYLLEYKILQGCKKQAFIRRFMVVIYINIYYTVHFLRVSLKLAESDSYE